MQDRAPAYCNPEDGHQTNGEIICTYDYCGEGRELLFQVVRFAPKKFLQRRPDDNGDWTWNLEGVRRVPYRLPELLAADPVQWVFIPEGEKDVERLTSLGLIATCNPAGAGKWREEFGPHLGHRQVAVLPDADDPGRDHAEWVAQSVAPYVSVVKIVELPSLPPRGDVSDWLDQGHTVDELAALVEAAPPWEPDTLSVAIEGECDISARQPSAKHTRIGTGTDSTWQEFIDRLKQRCPVEETALSLGLVARVRKQKIPMHCPFPNHRDERPSAVCYCATARWYCHVCGSGGDVIDLLMVARGLNWGGAVRELADGAGLELPPRRSAGSAKGKVTINVS